MRIWARLTCTISLAASACGGDEPIAAGPPDCSGLDTEACAAALRDAMTLSEKVAQMHGIGIAPVEDLYLTAENERLGVPGLAMVDGPRGVRAGKATAFPVGMARGASWDVALERRVGTAIGREAVAKGANVILAPTMNVLRHPAWGRAQETYGEDPAHIGAMAVAFVEGAQEELIASAKHFALNSIEDTRFDVNVTVDERTLREVYLPHFRRVVEARVGSVMSAYNRVNGFYCAENEHLLRDILKEEWAFDGFVESDWILGTRSTVGSALAGLDVEMPAPLFYGPALEDAVNAGQVPLAAIDEAVTRILRKKLEFDVGKEPGHGPEVVESEEHLALAREAAEKSIVLLKNEGALPLDAGAVGSVALVGSLAAVANMGDEGSSKVVPSEAVSPLAGVVALLGGAKVTHVDADVLSTADEAAVAAADAAVVVVGLTGADEGENLGTVGGDRDSLALSTEHAALVSQVAAHNARTIVVLEGGAAITMEWIDEVEAVVMAWYPGQEGGHALAAILFGEVNPSGRLPITFPTDASQLPPFDHESLEVTYGYDHGYRHLDRLELDPLFPFGFGLSYASFGYDAIALSASSIGAEDTLVVSVDVTNLSATAGEEVVQIYVSPPGVAVERPLFTLAGFSRVALAPGETKRVEVAIAARELAYYDVEAESWQLEPGSHQVLAGASSRDLPLAASFTVE